MARKGKRDCGSHDFYLAEETATVRTFRCYHCEPAELRFAHPDTIDVERAREAARERGWLRPDGTFIWDDDTPGCDSA